MVDWSDQFLLAFIFTHQYLGQNRLQANKLYLPANDNTLREKNTRTTDLRDLIADALFGASSKVATGVPGTVHPFFEWGKPHPSTRDGLDSLIAALRPGSSLELLENVTTGDPKGTLVPSGGPVANECARAIFGLGKGSPLFSLVGQPDALPVTFDWSRWREAGDDSDWQLNIQGQRVNSSEDFLVLTSIPNPYAEDRIQNFAGLRPAGTRAIELAVANEALLDFIRRSGKSCTGWQVVIPVTVVDDAPRKLGAPTFFEITAKFDKLCGLLSGKPLFSNPLVDEWSGLLGLAHSVLPISELFSTRDLLDRKMSRHGTVAQVPSHVRTQQDRSAALRSGEGERVAASPESEQMDDSGEHSLGKESSFSQSALDQLLSELDKYLAQTGRGQRGSRSHFDVLRGIDQFIEQHGRPKLTEEEEAELVRTSLAKLTR